MTTKSSRRDKIENKEVSPMEHTPAQELIRQLKEAKRQKEFTYPRIMERLEQHGHFVSLTTLRRVFADNSDGRSFNYETTLLPIAAVLLDPEDVPTDEDAPYAKEIDGLKAVIHVQNEEIVKLQELKEHLESRVTFLLEQIEKKDRRMDEKDEIIRKLMQKVLQ